MARILVVDDTPLMVQLVSLTLDKAGHETRGADNGAQGVAMAIEWKPDLVIMDVMMPEMDGYEATRRIRANAPTALTPIIVITAQDTLTEKIAAFQAGADDYMTKPFEPLELTARVEVHLKRSQLAAAGAVAIGAAKPKAAGHVFTCFSLRGGCGVSTIATGLSVALAQIWSRPVVLADMVLAAGHSALLMNVPIKRTWADLSTVETAEYDIAFVEQHLAPHPCGVRVLSSPVRVQDADLVDAQHVTAALDILQAHYDYIVADLPHDFRDTTLAVLDRASLVLMPFAPDLASVRSVAAALEVFHALDYPGEQIRLILNWTFPKATLPAGEIEKALKKKIDLMIPNDRDHVTRAIDRGEPLTLGDAASPLGVLLEDYAFGLSRNLEQEATPETPSAAWSRTAQRVGKLAAKKG